MPFYRFEKMKTHRFNPHLSTAVGPVIEGEFMYFRMVKKRAGTGAELHYHPNELMAFPLRGKVDCIVGKDRRIVQPGTFVHFPPYARHGFKATEDGDLHYLYIKDRTWTMIGAAADEALPDQALSAREVQRAVTEGRYPGRKKEPEKSRAIIEGLGNCYYPMIESLEAPAASGHCERWVEGTNIAFGFVESPPLHVQEAKRAPHEMFLYVIRGGLQAHIGREKRRAGAGDVLHVPRGRNYRFTVTKGRPVRYAAVRSTERLEAAVRKHGAADNWRG
ncbi:MAG: cupin domain-containing protein [Betaproteobacteria bacterium]|nr:cupin domain-containing protein [Betaproteobacteria bacterium]MDH3436504.1 cupin domain-containing protein [Betaproteobacteria bacterium]